MARKHREEKCEEGKVLEGVRVEELDSVGFYWSLISCCDILLFSPGYTYISYIYIRICESKTSSCTISTPWLALHSSFPRKKEKSLERE